MAGWLLFCLLLLLRLLELDEILLRIQLLAAQRESNVRENVGVNIGLKVIFVVLLVTGVAVAVVASIIWRFGFFRSSRRSGRRRRRSPSSTSMFDMLKFALVVGTDPSFVERRTFENVTFGALGSFGTVPQGGKALTYRCCRVHPDMRVAAVRIHAIAAHKVVASWDPVWGGIMGKVAHVSIRARTRCKEALTDGDLIGVVDERAR